MLIFRGFISTKKLARITLWRFTQMFQQKQLARITLWRFTQKFQQKQLAWITLWRFTQKFQQKQLARMTLWRFTQRFQQKQLAWVRLWRFTQRFPNPRKQILTTIIPPEVSLSFHGFIQYIRIYIYNFGGFPDFFSPSLRLQTKLF